jgi:xanthine dehydrogenase accessory factor
MHADLLQMAADLARGGEPFVLAVVVRRLPASSAQAGDMAVITAAGEFHGWLGGACTQPTVVREARQALADGRPRLLALLPEAGEPRPGVMVYPMTCHSGGMVEIYLEPVLPAPRLVVFGDSPTARALAKLGHAMGYLVSAAAPLPAAAPAAGLPRAPLFAVVAAMGEGDEEAVRAALGLAPDYLGVVASARRFAQLRETLLARGVPPAALDEIRSPAGLRIGAQAPEEIALSVLAEIVARRRSAAAQAEEARQEARKYEQKNVAAAGAAASPLAVDPVCGMTVETAGARHTCEHAGQAWYFCGSGCRARFLAHPEAYAAREGAAS